jgi:hypothetical protein
LDEETRLSPRVISLLRGAAFLPANARLGETLGRPRAFFRLKSLARYLYRDLFVKIKKNRVAALTRSRDYSYFLGKNRRDCFLS